MKNAKFLAAAAIAALALAGCNQSSTTASSEPGNNGTVAAVNVVMSISTKASSARLEWPRNGLYAIGLMLPTIVVGWPVAGKWMDRRLLSIAAVAASCLLLLLIPSCGGVSSGGGGGTTPPPTTYHVTVTGSSPGTAANAGQSTVVALVVD